MPSTRRKIFSEVALSNKLHDFIREVKDNPQFIIKIGLVTQIDFLGIDNALYSLRVDFDDSHIYEVTEQEWRSPLLPVHLIHIPEIFERVFVIFPIIGNNIIGYWVSRFNENSSNREIQPLSIDRKEYELQYTYNKEPYQREVVTKTLFPEKNVPTIANKIFKENLAPFEKEENEKGLSARLNPLINAKPGDTIVQGRANNAIILSYDNNTGGGYIDQVVGRESIKKDNRSTNYIHKAEDGSRIFIAENSDIDKRLKEDYNLEYHKRFDEGGSFSTIDTDGSASISLESTQNRIISLISDMPVSHMVLAEPLQEWLEDLLSVLLEFTSAFSGHFHLHPFGPTVPSIQAKAFKVPTQKVLNILKERILKHHSKQNVTN